MAEAAQMVMPAAMLLAYGICVRPTSMDVQDPQTPTLLSPREVEVLELVSLGLTNAAVAAHLAVSVATVKFYLASVYRTLQVHNRTEAVVAYLRLKTEQDGSYSPGKVPRWTSD